MISTTAHMAHSASRWRVAKIGPQCPLQNEETSATSAKITLVMHHMLGADLHQDSICSANLQHLLHGLSSSHPWSHGTLYSTKLHSASTWSRQEIYLTRISPPVWSIMLEHWMHSLKNCCWTRFSVGLTRC